MRCLVPVAGFVLLSLPVLAADLAPPSRIESVTVFPDRAEVVRVVAVDLPAGPHRLTLAGLPAGLIAESVRVDGAADDSLRLGSVEVRHRYSADLVSPRERELEDVIAALGRRDAALADRARVGQVRIDFITALGKSLPARAGEAVVNGLPDPEVWRKSWDVLGQGAEAAYADIRSANEERAQLAFELDARRRELDALRGGERASIDAVVGIEAAQPLHATLRLRYQLPGASWRPLYEARLDSTVPEVVLVQRAEVGQTTGEDWQGIGLVLSTARPALDMSMPELEPWFVDVSRSPEALPAPPVVMLERQADEMASVAGARAVPAATETVVAGFAAEYRVAGPVDLAADGSTRTFTITERTLPTALAVRATPRLLPQAFLTGETVFPGPEPLLPGPVSIYRDGAYAGTAGLDGLMPGATVRLPFGVDDLVTLDYRLETGGRSTEGVFSKDRRVERRYRIEVANRHDRSIPVTVVDQIPVPQDERIGVQLLPDATPPTLRDPEGRRGVLEWTATAAPGETRVIVFGYAVTFPEDLDVEGF